MERKVFVVLGVEYHGMSAVLSIWSSQGNAENAAALALENARVRMFFDEVVVEVWTVDRNMEGTPVWCRPTGGK